MVWSERAFRHDPQDKLCQMAQEADGYLDLVEIAFDCEAILGPNKNYPNQIDILRKRANELWAKIDKEEDALLPSGVVLRS